MDATFSILTQNPSSPHPSPAMAPPDWSTLPADAISIISTCISDDADYAHFRSVCTSFRSASPIRPHLPWLLLLDGHDMYSLTLSLCNFPDADPSTVPRLPEGLARGKSVCGCSLGWIALLDDAPGISLHNPFTGAHTRLPPLADLLWVNKSDRSFIHRNRVLPFRNFTAGLASKLVLSSDDPTAADTIVLAISKFRTRLICCHPGDAWWTIVPPFVGSMEMIDDIVYYKDKFYTVCGYRVYVVDIGPGYAIVYQIMPLDRRFSDGMEREGLYPNKGTYLVVSSGDLLLVSSTFSYAQGGHVENGDTKLFFEVFRVDLDFSETIISGQLSLFTMGNVGGCSLFVGSSGSMSVSAGTSPWCRGNCIYYICKATKKKGTVAVYCMEDDSLSSVAGFDSSVDSIAYQDFSWFTPRLC